MQERVYKTPVRDTNDLKQRLVDTWASIPQNVVDEAVLFVSLLFYSSVKSSKYHKQ